MYDGAISHHPVGFVGAVQGVGGDVVMEPKHTERSVEVLAPLGVLAGGKAEGENGMHLVVVDNGHIQELRVLWVILRYEGTIILVLLVADEES